MDSFPPKCQCSRGNYTAKLGLTLLGGAGSWWINCRSVVWITHFLVFSTWASPPASLVVWVRAQQEHLPGIYIHHLVGEYNLLAATLASYYMIMLWWCSFTLRITFVLDECMTYKRYKICRKNITWNDKHVIDKNGNAQRNSPIAHVFVKPSNYKISTINPRALRILVIVTERLARERERDREI